MNSYLKLLAIGSLLMLPSCVSSPKQPVNLLPTLMQSGPISKQGSQTSSETEPSEKFVPCSALGGGSLSVKDTVETLATLAPILEVIRKTCG